MSKSLKRIIIAGITLAVLAALSWGTYRIYSYYYKGRIVKVVKLTEFQKDYPVMQAAFSPDGQKVAVVINDATPQPVVEIRDVQTGRVDKSLPLPKPLDPYYHYSDRIEFSSAGLVLFTTIHHAIVWDATTGKMCFHIEYEPLKLELDKYSRLAGATFSSDGTELAIWGQSFHDYHGILQILDAKTGQKKEEIPAKWLKKIDFNGHEYDRIVFSPDNASLLLTFQGQVYIWDRKLSKVTSIRPSSEFYYDNIRQLAFSADAKKIFGLTTSFKRTFLYESFPILEKQQEKLPNQLPSVSWELSFQLSQLYYQHRFLWKNGLHPILLPRSLDLNAKWFGESQNFIEVMDTSGRTYPLSLSAFGSGNSKQHYSYNDLLDTTISQDGRYFTAILSSGRIITWDLGAFAEKVKVKSTN